MNIFRSLIAGIAMLTLSACAMPSGEVPTSPLGQVVAETIVEVSDVNRDLRICWMAAGAIEVMTDLAQQDGGAQDALGGLTMLQGAIDKARNTDTLWAETDAADVSLLFAEVLKEMGKSRLSQILLGGPTVGNFLKVAKRTVILTVKGRAVMNDINSVLNGVEDGTITKVEAWKACEDRTATNRNSLRMMLGLTVSSTETFGTQTVIDPFDWIGGGSGGIGPFDWIGGTQSEIGGGGGTGPFEKQTIEWYLVSGVAPFGTETIIYPDGWIGGTHDVFAYWPPGNTSFFDKSLA